MSITLRLVALLFLGALGLSPPARADDDPLAADAAPQIDVPFTLPLPDGWRAETIPFPLEFADQLPYRGLEEIRFSPGMFDSTSANYWSYIFVWWVDNATAPGPKVLEGNLVDYFDGLTQAVAESTQFSPGNVEYFCYLEPSEDGPLYGKMITYDAFVRRAPVELNMRVTSWPCDEAAMRVIFFELSPQPGNHEVWESFNEIRDGFVCPQ